MTLKSRLGFHAARHSGYEYYYGCCCCVNRMGGVGFIRSKKNEQEEQKQHTLQGSERGGR
jgi:hypothetical protein